MPYPTDNEVLATGLQSLK